MVRRLLLKIGEGPAQKRDGGHCTNRVPHDNILSLSPHVLTRSHAYSHHTGSAQSLIAVAMEDAASKKAYVVAVVVQVIYTGLSVLSKAAFNDGMSIFVFNFYRQATGSLLLLPLALLFQR